MLCYNLHNQDYAEEVLLWGASFLFSCFMVFLTELRSFILGYILRPSFCLTVIFCPYFQGKILLVCQFSQVGFKFAILLLQYPRVLGLQMCTATPENGCLPNTSIKRKHSFHWEIHRMKVPTVVKYLSTERFY